MASTQNQELIERFEEFYRSYYRDAIGELAQRYPDEERSLTVDWGDLYRFDQDLADDLRTQPGQLIGYAEEALRRYDLPADVSLGQAHLRVRNLPESLPIREIRAVDVNHLVEVRGIIRKATSVRPKIQSAAFECQRCGTLTRIPQSSGNFQEPHECQGCERQGPFRINFDQSEFVDAQKLRIQESPEGLRGGETPQSIDVHIEDDITGRVSPGDHVRATGILHLEQQGSDREKSTMFDIFMEGVEIEVEDEQFEEMDISQEDKRAIVELSNEPDIYDRMVGSIAPTIYGHDQAKLAMVLQLFSGVTKHLPDGSRTRGDLHMLLIGDPGTGKCVSGDTNVTLSDGSRVPIRDIVESSLDDPIPVDDGVYQNVDFSVPSLQPDGSIDHQRVTRVWKREAPDYLYRIRTASGKQIEVTPSHPLFVPAGDSYKPVRADLLAAGDPIAVREQGSVDAVRADGGVLAKSPTAFRGDAADQSRDITVETETIDGIERIDPPERWVYDLEVQGTHNYISNDIFSHNSQLLQYIRHIAPRSVYTSGKGSSAAGLCVTGDTRIHTTAGFERIRDIVHQKLPEPVTDETAERDRRRVYTFDRETGVTDVGESSHVWRMPEKPCRRIETERGKELEASRNTPVLTCGELGIEWTPIADVGPGDYVAIPRYDDVERTAVPTRDYLEFTNEKLKLDEESLSLIRRRLLDRFGTLRTAAAELGLSEDVIYSHLWNRYVPVETLETILEATTTGWRELTIERAMLRHGDSVRIPQTFDEELMYLIGLVFGDGDIRLSPRGDNRGMVRISSGDEDLLHRARDVIETVFDKRVEIERQEDRVPSIRLHSATIAQFFRNVGMRTPKRGLALDARLTTAEHADAFLRGLMDADGSVSVRNRGGSGVLISTISEELGKQIQLMLETYGIRARRRERDRRGTSRLENGHEIRSQHVQHVVELFGADVDRYAEAIGFESAAKRAALARIVNDAPRRGEVLPVAATLATVDGPAGRHWKNLRGGSNPGRDRARSILEEVGLGGAEPIVREVVDAEIGWEEVVAAVDTGEKEVFDLTVPETHNFIGNGIVTHNTAAAVRDDFADGNQWTLEAGAMVLADQGIAAIDELDKMRCVTGDSIVRMGGDDEIEIAELAQNAVNEPSTEVEALPNGRTIRGLHHAVRTMDDDGRIVTRPITAIHEYEAPPRLVRVILQNNASIVTTPDHPFLIEKDDGHGEKRAERIRVGDRVLVPAPRDIAADGAGTGSVDHHDAVMMRGEMRSGDVVSSPVTSVLVVESEPTTRVYDLTVEDTHNFIANDMVIHNSEDRSALHEALEQQSISISKAGINATLKARCSLLGAANPKYGRFDQYESIGEQIDLEPALISRFDLIFTVSDQPDPEDDRRLAQHILRTNYAGELNTQLERLNASDVAPEELEAVADTVTPAIEPDLFRKYVAYAQQNCYPRMSEEAMEAIQDFYVDLRSKGADEDAPVPVTARKLEALVRLSEASARVRLSDTVERKDADRVIEIVRLCLQDIGVDPETGEYDVDVIETGRSKTQRDRVKGLKGIIRELQDEYDEGAPVEEVLAKAESVGIERGKAEHEIQKLRDKGEIYTPAQDHLRVV